MRIAISGYGKMGRRVRALALERGHQVVAIIDPLIEDAEVTSRTLTPLSLSDAEVVIDFTHPSVVADNILMYGKCGIPAVVGTTGWYEKKAQLEELLEGEKYRILYSGNFSLGVAAFMKITEYASTLFDKLDSYDVSVHEVHHNGKADSPSGTALMLTARLLENISRKESFDTECQHSKIGEGVIHVSSERVGHVPGIHTVTFDSAEDTITLTHSARSRDGFASGAIQAAAWLVGCGKDGFLTLDDFINDFLGEKN